MPKGKGKKTKAKEQAKKGAMKAKAGFQKFKAGAGKVGANMAQTGDAMKAEMEKGGAPLALYFIAFIVGMIMMILAKSKHAECKMRIIDSSSWTNDSVYGNLIKWHIYTGSVHMWSGVTGLFALGPLAVGIKEGCYCQCIGICFHDIITGLAGKILLFFFFLLQFFCNILGYFWLHMARMGRDEYNSEEPGMENYCHPAIWNLAHVVVYLFFIVATVVIVKVGSEAHKLFRGDESFLEIIELGKNPETGEDDKMVMPKKRVGSERKGNELPR